jgi:hypothetical protein
VNGRRRGTRLLAGGLAVMVMSTALGACSSDGPSRAEVAAEDRDVVAANKLDKANVAKLKAALRVKWQKRARARRAAAARRYRARAATRPRRVVVGGQSVSSVDFCAPIKRRFGGKAGRAERNWRRMQRKRALFYLNLHC